jgi:hypothetical protein
MASGINMLPPTSRKTAANALRNPVVVGSIAHIIDASQ